MADQDFVLRMVGIHKRFPGVLALDQVDFQVRPGQVHALMGENGAGKSTLMNCLFGIHHADSGQVFLDGRPVRFRGTRDALDAGVAMIQQELCNVPRRSVQENVWLGREACRRLGPLRLLDHRQNRRNTVALMRELEIEIAPEALVGDLSISRQQLCEIAKAISCNARIVVMDEPTSSISEVETEHLFRIIRGLKDRGVAVVYISHKMDEIFRIADEISVMRDGCMVGTFPAGAMDEERLIQLMVGRDTSKRFPPIASEPGPVRLEVDGLTAADPRSFKDVSFSLRRGEILGIGGLVGAQRTELVEALFGLRPVASGSIRVDGREVRIRSSRDAIAHGIALITEDRRRSGIFPLLPVWTNTAMAGLGRFRGPLGVLGRRRMLQACAEIIEKMRTKCPSLQTPIGNLSGGNQQKVLVARWLLTMPDILIMDEPTRGIDVGAKFEIYTIMDELVRAGKAIIMVSSELAELVALAHRVMVLCQGRQTGTLERAQATQENIMRLAAKFE
jgi:methyl-galactoside transport system ATP-binding protein